MKKIKISASILSTDFLHLGEEIKKTEAAGADSFHLDVMDNHLAPNLSFGPPIIKHIRKATNLPLDAHLMIDNPGLFLDNYINLKVECISVHVESYALKKPNPLLIKTQPRSTTKIDLKALAKDLTYLKSKNILAEITLNPDTPISCIQEILPFCDSVLIMSVNPGFSGQSFRPEVLTKIKELKKIFTKEIKIDGGINSKTAPLALAAGVDTLITASYLYGAKDYKQAIASLKSTPLSRSSKWERGGAKRRGELTAEEGNVERRTLNEKKVRPKRERNLKNDQTKYRPRSYL
jgi:ribulose-phosphate 3-epimerase